MIMLGDKKKKMIGAILGDGRKEEEAEMPQDSLHALMQELMECLKSDDVAGAASAFKAAFQECDSEPHVEGPHTEE